MDIKFVKRNIFQRIFGVPATQKPGSTDCWEYKNGKLVISLDKVPELKKQGGAIRLEGGRLPARVLVVFGDNGEYRAYQNKCTHLGHRRLDPVPGTNTVQCCSLNKSTFDSKGKHIFGPAPHPIKSYPVEKDQKNLIVSISKE